MRQPILHYAFSSTYIGVISVHTSFDFEEQVDHRSSGTGLRKKPKNKKKKKRKMTTKDLEDATILDNTDKCILSSSGQILVVAVYGFVHEALTVRDCDILVQA